MPESNSGSREAMDRLVENDRVLREARMPISKDKALAVEQIAEIADRFKTYAGENRISLAQVARELNYSGSVLSQ